MEAPPPLVPQNNTVLPPMVYLQFQTVICATERSQLWTGQHRIHGTVAIKQISRQGSNAARALPREYEMLMAIGTHPNIVQALDLLVADDHWNLVMPKLNNDGRTLLTLVSQRGDRKQNGLSMAEWRPLLQQIVSALNFCHHRRICHHDVKLQNIVLCDNDTRAVLCDWEFSQQLIDGEGRPKLCTSAAGTIECAPPEMFGNCAHDGLAGDVWSLAVCWYAVRTCHMPFGSVRRSKRESELEVRQRIASGHWSEQYFSPEQDDVELQLLRRMLAVSQDSRPSINFLRQSPFIFPARSRRRRAASKKKAQQ